LHAALGKDLPVGVCPHDHDCQFRAAGQSSPRSTRFNWRDAFRSRD
jgi:hypothetical protein